MRKKETIQVFCLIIILLVELVTFLFWDEQDEIQNNYSRTINKEDIQITNEQKKIWESLDSATKKELYERFKNYYK